VFAVTKTLKMRKTAIQAYAKDGQSRLKTHPPAKHRTFSDSI